MVKPGMYPPPPPTTPRLAPWDAVQELCDRLDRLITILEGAAPPPEWSGWGPITTKLDEIKNQLAEIKITTAWEAGEPLEIYREEIRTTGTFLSGRMVNWTKGKRLLLKVNSSLDQAVQIQPIGNTLDAVDGATNINASFPCPPGRRISIGLAWDDWHPYVGCEITVAVAPTIGTLTISSVIQG